MAIVKTTNNQTNTSGSDPNGASGNAARRALGLLVVPLTVTNQVATRPNGDGEGPGHR